MKASAPTEPNANSLTSLVISMTAISVSVIYVAPTHCKIESHRAPSAFVAPATCPCGCWVREFQCAARETIKEIAGTVSTVPTLELSGLGCQTRSGEIKSLRHPTLRRKPFENSCQTIIQTEKTPLIHFVRGWRYHFVINELLVKHTRITRNFCLSDHNTPCVRVIAIGSSY